VTAKRKAATPAVRKALKGLALDPGKWMSIKIERGDEIPLDDVVHYLRHGGSVSKTMRNYLADLIEGKIKRSRGRPKERWQPYRQWRLRGAARDTRRIQHVWKVRYRRTRGAFEHAVEWAARKWQVESEALRNYIRRGRRAR